MGREILADEKSPFQQALVRDGSCGSKSGAKEHPNKLPALETLKGRGEFMDAKGHRVYF